MSRKRRIHTYMYPSMIRSSIPVFSASLTGTAPCNLESLTINSKKQTHPWIIVGNSRKKKKSHGSPRPFAAPLPCAVSSKWRRPPPPRPSVPILHQPAAQAWRRYRYRYRYRLLAAICRSRGRVPGDSPAAQVPSTSCYSRRQARSLMQSNQLLALHSFRASVVSPPWHVDTGRPCRAEDHQHQHRE